MRSLALASFRVPTPEDHLSLLLLPLLLVFGDGNFIF